MDSDAYKYRKFKTYSFYQLEGFSCLLQLFFLSSTILFHRRQSLGDIVLVPFTNLMCSDAERIVGYENFTQVAPFVSLAHPILKQDMKSY
jgi:hypothetical protein